MPVRYDPTIHHRRSIRLPEYNYAWAGAYFITICAHRQQRLFGRVINGEMWLNRYGEIVREEWFRSAEIRAEIELDAFVVMPNHVHGIVLIVSDWKPHDDVGATGRSPLQNKQNKPCGPSPKSLGAFIAGFKSATTKRINELRGTPGAPIWQRNYYEHVIRHEKAFAHIQDYILNNPANWDSDRENPNRTRDDDFYRWLTEWGKVRPVQQKRT